jgi:anti-anti-sigma regulatory factor
MVVSETHSAEGVVTTETVALALSASICIEMARKTDDQRDGSPSPPASETQLSCDSLVVHLHRESHGCIASFSGELTATTRMTIEGVAGLIAGEPSVVLDFSRVTLVDEDGADAIEMLVTSVRACGSHLQVTESKGRMDASPCARGDRHQLAPLKRSLE